MTDRERLGTMTDLTVGLSAEDRLRIDAIKAEMIDAEGDDGPVAAPEA